MNRQTDIVRAMHMRCVVKMCQLTIQMALYAHFYQPNIQRVAYCNLHEPD